MSEDTVEEPHPAIEDVLSFLAHELNTPVTIIAGFSQILTNSEGVDQQEYLALVKTAALNIGKATNNLQDLIVRLVDAHSLSQDQLILRMEFTDMCALVQETIVDLQYFCHHRILQRSEPGPINLFIDRTRIRQVLMNLLTNATKFSPRDQEVVVALATYNDHMVKVTVDDEGPGVPEELLPRLFQKFSRLDPSVKGTGLGLFISRGITQAHNGNLTYERLPGVSRFTLELPRIIDGQLSA